MSKKYVWFTKDLVEAEHAKDSGGDYFRFVGHYQVHCDTPPEWIDVDHLRRNYPITAYSPYGIDEWVISAAATGSLPQVIKKPVAAAVTTSPAATTQSSSPALQALNWWNQNHPNGHWIWETYDVTEKDDAVAEGAHAFKLGTTRSYFNIESALPPLWVRQLVTHLNIGAKDIRPGGSNIGYWYFYTGGGVLRSNRNDALQNYTNVLQTSQVAVAQAIFNAGTITTSPSSGTNTSAGWTVTTGTATGTVSGRGTYSGISANRTMFPFLPFDYENTKPAAPSIEKNCLECGLELCPELDAYYGTDSYEAKCCYKCRKAS